MMIYFEEETKVVIAKDIYILCTSEFDYVVEEDYHATNYETWFGSDARVLFESLKRKDKSKV